MSDKHECSDHMVLVHNSTIGGNKFPMLLCLVCGDWFTVGERGTEVRQGQGAQWDPKAYAQIGEDVSRLLSDREYKRPR